MASKKEVRIWSMDAGCEAYLVLKLVVPTPGRLRLVIVWR